MQKVIMLSKMFNNAYLNYADSLPQDPEAAEHLLKVFALMFAVLNLEEEIEEEEEEIPIAC